jgi:hypothetical protein
MFHQLLTPVGNSLALSCLVAGLPVLIVLLLLGVLRRPAWQAALAGLICALIVAIVPWQMPIALALHSVLNGATFALWPVMWIVVNGLLLYNISVRSGRFDALRTWVIRHLPNDRRVVLVVIGFCFGALLEGVAGFRHTGGGHRRAADHGGVPAARSDRVRAALQYRASRIRRTGYPGYGARGRDGLPAMALSSDDRSAALP